jgi:hypothetical protein
VVSDIPVDDEAPLVTSGISRSVSAQSFGGAHRGRVCVRVFIGVSVRVCCERLRCTMSFSKREEEARKRDPGVRVSREASREESRGASPTWICNCMCMAGTHKDWEGVSMWVAERITWQESYSVVGTPKQRGTFTLEATCWNRHRITTRGRRQPFLRGQKTQWQQTQPTWDISRKIQSHKMQGFYPPRGPNLPKFFVSLFIIQSLQNHTNSHLTKCMNSSLGWISKRGPIRSLLKVLIHHQWEGTSPLEP